MCDTLSLTNSSLLTADMIPFCTKKKYLIHDSHSPFFRKMCILPQVRCHLPLIWPPALPLNLTYIWLVPSKPALYRLLTFHVPNLISTFCSLGRLSKESVLVRGLSKLFVTNLFFTVKGC
jgi:hypothetical protein